MRKSSFDMIDVLKLLAAGMIFIMHTGQLQAIPALGFSWEVLSRWGVPFFFLVTSFFLFSKETDGQLDEAVLRRYCRRIALLYSGWFVLNLPGTLAAFAGTHDIRSLSAWLEFFKNALLSSTFTGSWYLLSCMFSAWFVSMLGKRVSDTGTLLAALPFQILCILSSAYAGLAGKELAAVLEFLCFPLNLFGGCFCFALGRILAHHREKLSRMRRAGIVLALGGCAAFFAEMLGAHRFSWFGTSDQGIFLVPWALGIFLTAVTSRKQIRHAVQYRTLSTVIYCGQGNVHAFRSILRIVFGIESPVILLAVSIILMALIVWVFLYCRKKNTPAWFANLV